MNDKRCIRGYASEKFNEPKRERELLSEEQVVGQLNASVLLFIKEVELSIYKFLASGAKTAKKWPRSIELQFDWLTSR